MGAILNDHSNKNFNKEYNPSLIKIPNKDEWKIVLWHLGRDSLGQYSGKMFECSWGVAKNLFIRIYSKELQEDPDILFKQLLHDFIKTSTKKRLIEILN